MTLALLFPGQGSQAVGMGDDFRRSFPSVRRCLDQAGERLGIDLCAVIAKGPPSLLAKTHIAQPAIFALSCAVGDLLAARGVQPRCAAGHSLGEFTALAVAGAMTFEVGLDLVVERGRLMHLVNEAVDGGMMAVSGIDGDTINGILEQTGGQVWIANWNAPSQTVLSGLRSPLREAQDLIVARGGRASWLDVAGPYHSPLLRGAAMSFAAAIAEASFRDAAYPIISNAGAEAISQADEIRAELLQHMLAPVDWGGTIRRMRRMQVDELVDVGPGRAMKGLALRNDPSVACWTIGTVRDFDETCRRLEGAACASL